MVASLARRFGDLDLAEDATGEALVVAAERWPVEGVPPNPGGWLTTVAATRRSTGSAARSAARTSTRRCPAWTVNDDPPEPTGPVEDDRLRLLFTCCHPALAPENRVALTLRLLGGLTVAEIAAAFLRPRDDDGAADHPLEAEDQGRQHPLPDPAAPTTCRSGWSGVLAVLYLVFNEGYLGSSGQALRTDLTTEAIRLTRQLREMLAATPSLGRQPEVDGLLALMLLVDSRGQARVHEGVLVALDEQDRTLWDAEMIDEGHQLVRRCLALNRAGPYQLQAAINAVHTDALDASMTDWSQVLQLFDQLLAMTPSPVVALNRAVAVAEVDGPEVALALVEPLQLTSYHAWHATRADLLRRLGRTTRHARPTTGRSTWPGTRPSGFLRHRRDGLPDLR